MTYNQTFHPSSLPDAHVFHSDSSGKGDWDERSPSFLVPRTSGTLILGVGNYLMGDEGVGVHVARQLQEEILPGLADVMDGGTAGFQLMEYIESYPRVILIDAVLDDCIPGTIRLIRPKFASDFPKAMSTHEIGLKDLIESLTLLDRLPDVYLFTVSIPSVQPLSVELSEHVKAVLPDLKQKIMECCRSFELLFQGSGS